MTRRTLLAAILLLLYAVPACAQDTTRVVSASGDTITLVGARVIDAGGTDPDPGPDPDPSPRDSVWISSVEADSVEVSVSFLEEELAVIAIGMRDPASNRPVCPPIRPDGDGLIRSPAVTWCQRANADYAVFAGDPFPRTLGTVTIPTKQGGTSPPPPPTGPPPTLPPPAGSVAELPRQKPDLPTGYPRQIHVPSGANLQAAIDLAQAGDELLLEPGGLYVAEHRLRNRGDQGWVRIATDLPSVPAGQRLELGHNLAKVTCRGTNCAAFRWDAGADGWELSLLEVTTEERHVNSPLVAHQTADTPQRILIDRVWSHPQTYVSRCALLNAEHVTIRYSQFTDCVNPGQQTQAVASWNHNGIWHVHDNYLEFAAMCTMFGGAARPAGVRPADVTIERNWCHVPPQFQGVYHSVANFEVKDVIRLHVRANVFDGGAWAFLLKSSSQQGVARMPVGTEDVTVEYNVLRNAGNCINLLRQQSGGPTLPMARVEFRHNICEQIGPDSQGWTGYTGQLFQILQGGADDLVVRNNTFDTRGNTFINGLNPAPGLVPGFVYEENVVNRATRYGMHTTGGSTWSDVWSSFTLGTTYGHCGNIKAPAVCQSAIPSGAGADVAEVRRQTAGVAN